MSPTPRTARLTARLLEQLTIARKAMQEAEHIVEGMTAVDGESMLDERFDAKLKAIARSAADLLELFGDPDDEDGEDVGPACDPDSERFCAD